MSFTPIRRRRVFVRWRRVDTALRSTYANLHNFGIRMQHFHKTFPHRCLLTRLGTPKRWQSTTTTPLARAMVYSQYGRPSEVLRVHTHRLPPITSKTLHLRFLAAPINPADVNQVEGVYPVKPPFTKELDTQDEVAVGGNEGVAEVIDAGEEVNELKRGDWVVMARAGFGTWRTYAVAKPEEVHRISKEGLSKVQAATLAVNPCTAYRMLKDFVTLEKGDFVIQNGANSAVGQAVIQIAKAWGINTMNIVRNRPNVDELIASLHSLGATHIILGDQLSSPSTKQQVKELTKGKGIQLGLNCVGGANGTDMAKLLGNAAHHVTYGAMSRKPLTIAASHLIFKDIHFSGFWMSRWNDMHPKEERAEMLDDVVMMTKRGELREVPHHATRWGPDIDEKEAHTAFLETLGHAGVGFGGQKQVLIMD